MLFVFLAHFGFVYLSTRAPEQERWTSSIGKIASPTFMVISGMMLGFLYRVGPNSFDRVRRKLVDRGLFLITVGHLVIVFAHVAISGSIATAFTWGFITDAIGFSIILGPVVITLLSPLSRVMVPLGMYGVSWLAAARWWPEHSYQEFLKETLFGSLGESQFYFYNFPLLPWFCLYLSSSVLGERIAIHFFKGDLDAMPRSVLRTALACGALAAVLVGYRGLALLGWVPTSGGVLLLTDLGQKLPPSPAYFLFYTAIGLGIMWFLLEAELRGRLPKLLDTLGLLGRTSLFAFLLQYYVYYTILFLLPIPYSPLWPLLLVASGILIFLLSDFWYRLRGNRLITVGFAKKVGKK